MNVLFLKDSIINIAFSSNWLGKALAKIIITVELFGNRILVFNIMSIIGVLGLVGQ